MLMEIESRAVALCLGAALVLAACGGSDSNKSNPSTAGGGAGHSGSGGSTGPAPLTDNVVGKACTANSDCANGLCSMSFGGNGLTGTMGTPAPGGYCTSSCAADSDCGSTGTCVGAFAGIPGLPIGGAGGATRGQCYLGCTMSDQCRDGYRCVNGLGIPVTAAAGSGGGGGAAAPGLNALGGASSCQPAPVTDKLTGSTVGSMCTADTDCGAGRCAANNGLGTTYPGGYCTGRCLQDSDCGDVGSCTPGFAGMVGTCYRKCSSDTDCDRDGYRCRMTSNSVMQCVPGPKPLADGTVGNACTADADCGGAAMSCSTGTRYPGGYCTQRCGDASDCGSGGTCTGAIGGGALTGTCYKTCTATTDCRTGYACGAVGFAGGGNASPMVCTLA
ncbi:MAG TPA: hypothetical protein VHZ95_09350, partial [Polyangiales bacterium]|nr:hypothetical protein [Polyangiales bacterium]